MAPPFSFAVFPEKRVSWLQKRERFPFSGAFCSSIQQMAPPFKAELFVKNRGLTLPAQIRFWQEIAPPFKPARLRVKEIGETFLDKEKVWA